MNRSLLLSLLLLLPAYLMSQEISIHGEVLDITDGNPLPYSNIMILNHSVGTTADKNGKFSLNINDSLKKSLLVISFVGYKSEKVNITPGQYLQIKLTQEDFKISEVIVKPLKKNKAVVLNNFKKGQCFLRYSKAPFDTSGNLHVPYRPTEPAVEAIYFTASEENINRPIKEVRLALRNLGVKESVFRLRILKTGRDQAPGEDFIKTPILVNYRGESETIINLEKYNLHLVDPGIFIGVEVLIIPGNEYRVTNKSNSEALLYSPFLLSLESDSNGEYWIYSKGIWQETKYWYFKDGIWFESDDKNIIHSRATKPVLLKPAISMILN